MGSQGSTAHGLQHATARPVAFRATYTTTAAPAGPLRKDVLASFDFGLACSASTEPRQVAVRLATLGQTPAREVWTVAAPVASGRSRALRWTTGGGWRLTVVELQETAPGGIEQASEAAYQQLLQHVTASAEPHLQRIWNYLGAINQGAGDAERYRLFCNGRARAMAAHGLTHYPAATAIGHHGRQNLLQVYALSACAPGQSMENPRQVSAWKYPRQYGPTAPNFARAMRMPTDALAISGTAAVVGHASHYPHDVTAQVQAACANLDALLRGAAAGAFNAASPLKVYFRDPGDAAAIEAALAQYLDPAVPRLLLHGDICRRELLVEIDGWHFAG